MFQMEGKLDKKSLQLLNAYSVHYINEVSEIIPSLKIRTLKTWSHFHKDEGGAWS